MPDGQKWKVQWRGGRPVIPELEKWFNPRYGEVINPDEEMYGVTINPATDEVILPTGERASYTWWQTLSPQRKAEMTTGGAQINKQANTVTLPSGRSFTLKAWQKMTPEKQKELTGTTPTAPTEQKWRVGGAVGAALRGETIQGIENLTPEELMAYQSWMPYIQKAEERRLDIEQIKAQAIQDYVGKQTLGAQRYATAKWQTETPQGMAATRLGGETLGGSSMQRAVGGAEVLWEAKQKDLAIERYNAQVQGLKSGFEQARQQILQTTSPRDWVIRERVKVAENPYASIPREYYHGYSGDTRELSLTDVSVGMPLSKQIENMMNPVGGEGLYGKAVPSGIQKFLGNRNPYGTQQQVQGVIPGWNPPFAQGRPNPYEFVPYAAGTFGTNVETPSMQGWAAAPWTVREQLMGYLEAMGQQPADLLASMQRMQPSEPSRGTSWRPRLQYA